MILQKAVPIFELLSVIIGFIYYKKYFNTPLKYFTFLLAITTFIECASTFHFNKMAVNNTAVHNVLNYINYIYYYYLFYCFSKKTIHRKIIFSLGIIQTIVVIINFGFLQKLGKTGVFASYTFTVGAVFLVIAIGLYIVELLKSDEILQIKRNLMFWISSGLLIYYVGVLPSLIGVRFLPSSQLVGVSYIFFSLSIIMYSCFIFGFIWSKRLSS